MCNNCNNCFGGLFNFLFESRCLACSGGSCNPGSSYDAYYAAQYGLNGGSNYSGFNRCNGCNKCCECNN